MHRAVCQALDRDPTTCLVGHRVFREATDQCLSDGEPVGLGVIELPGPPGERDDSLLHLLEANDLESALGDSGTIGLIGGSTLAILAPGRSRTDLEGWIRDLGRGLNPDGAEPIPDFRWAVVATRDRSQSFDDLFHQARSVVAETDAAQDRRRTV